MSKIKGIDSLTKGSRADGKSVLANGLAATAEQSEREREIPKSAYL